MLVKPLDKGPYHPDFKKHADAKPELLSRLGCFCSYCEAPASAQQIAVEHIYPQAPTAHPRRHNKWRNYLLACPTCNTYKLHRLKSVRQKQLYKQYLWPHIDNTFRAFKYSQDGAIKVDAGVDATIVPLAKSTIELTGLMMTQGIANDYQSLGIAYSHIEKRKEAWEIATHALEAYKENPSVRQIVSTVDMCKKTGYFSIWMLVFSAYPTMLKEFVKACKAHNDCFDNNGRSIKWGRT